MKIVLTGASGYIGSRIIALNEAHEIIAATRYPVTTAVAWIPFDFETTSSPVLPHDTNAVIHLAADTSGKEDSGLTEVIAARRLIEAACRIGARFIFVSSQAARKDSPSLYGRTKWNIEQDVLKNNGLVIRLGQVYGGPERALFGTLVTLVRKCPILPKFIPPPLIQPIHVYDCAKILLRLADGKNIPLGKVYSVASDKPVSFTYFLKMIAKHRVHQKRLFLPVPIFIVTLIGKLSGEKWKGRLKINRLESLFYLPQMQTSDDLNTIGIKLQSLQYGLSNTRGKRRQKVLQEGEGLLSYILKIRPDSDLVQRYVDMIEKLRNGQPLNLPVLFYCRPQFLLLLDSSVFSRLAVGEELQWRLNAATLISESSILGANRFVNKDSAVSIPLVILRMGMVCLKELFVRVSRFFLFPLLWIALKNCKYNDC